MTFHNEGVEFDGMLSGSRPSTMTETRTDARMEEMSEEVLEQELKGRVCVCVCGEGKILANKEHNCTLFYPCVKESSVPDFTYNSFCFLASNSIVYIHMPVRCSSKGDVHSVTYVSYLCCQHVCHVLKPVSAPAPRIFVIYIRGIKYL